MAPPPSRAEAFTASVASAISDTNWALAAIFALLAVCAYGLFRRCAANWSAADVVTERQALTH
jgi:hypothetical protein